MHVVIDRETYEFPAGWSVLDGSMTRRTKDNEPPSRGFPRRVTRRCEAARRAWQRRRSHRESLRVCDASGPAEYRGYSSTRLPDRIATRQPLRRSTRWRLSASSVTSHLRPRFPMRMNLDQDRGEPACTQVRPCICHVV